jgi:hypothetical protein
LPIGFVYKGGVHSTFTVPGATVTLPVGVWEVIVGGYGDEAGAVHGFVDRDGTFTNVDFPGATSTIVYDINKAGDMAGAWTDGSNHAHGFIDQGGVYLDRRSGSP